MNRLKGKTAVVVGAGSIGPGWGNGKATAVSFAREGAQVFCVDRNAAAAEETVNLIKSEGGKAAAFRVQNALQLIRISNNLGDAKSLVTHPTTTTHFRLTQEQRLELGINDGLIRLSVGLEAAVDLQADLDRALAKV